MSTPMDWSIRAKHKNGLPLTVDEVKELVALDTFDLAAVDFDNPWFFTESNGAYMRIAEALTAFAKDHPDVRMFVEYKYDTAWCPDAMLVTDGLVYGLTGRVTYTYDLTDEEVKSW